MFSTLVYNDLHVTYSSFYHLRRLMHVRHSVGQELTAKLVNAFLWLLSRLDYGNSVFAGLPKSNTTPLQRAQNAAARLILRLWAHDHVTPALRQLRWLLIHQHIHINCEPWCTLLVMECARYASTQSLLTTRHDPVCALLTARCTGYQDVVHPWASVHCAFSYSGPLAWNALPSTLRNIAEHTRFRKLLKTHLFDLGL